RAPAGQEGFAAISSYILKVTKLGRRRLGAIFERHIGAASMKKFESTYDRITRESLAEGETRGETKGRIATLLRLLGRRFGALPATITRRVQAASSTDLDRWTDRTLDAKTLAEVFER
ncbi:MAG: DUF4351 domain-containing protein, partial [Planctomycetota bacterium]